jgi:uncharacterized protein (TIGR02246 family)
MPQAHLRIRRLATALTVALAPTGQQAPIVPAGNYHAHIMSEAASKLLEVSRLPGIAIPAPLTPLIQEFESAQKSGDPSAFAALFTPDGFYRQPTGWVRGRQRIEAARANEGGRDVRVKAHQVTLGDSTATIIASFIDPASDQDLEKATLTLARGQDGRWLIASLQREDRTAAELRATAATNLIAQLDSAGIRKALVLSTAYWFGSALMPGAQPDMPIDQEYARVRAENDWVISETAKYPARLYPFCSFHPLKSYALAEIERCAAIKGVRGIKLHLANSGVDLRSPADVAQLRSVFAACNTKRLPIVVHMRPRLQPYGRQDVELFISEILSAAPDIPVQIAHFAGWGGYDDSTDAAIGAFADAIAAKNPVMSRITFDFTQVAFSGQSADRRRKIADRIRQVGIGRVVYGSDSDSPKKNWAEVRKALPLTRAEFRSMAANVSPLLK